MGGVRKEEVLPLFIDREAKKTITGKEEEERRQGTGTRLASVCEWFIQRPLGNI